MTAVASDRGPQGLAAVLAAARSRLSLVFLLFVLAGVGWWRTVDEMRGMDQGPWTSLGPIGWFLGVWVVMMAAMMLPSVAPTAALYSKLTRRRSPIFPLLFSAGYLLTWAATGLVAFAVGHLASAVSGGALGWDRLGRPLAAATLLAAAAYQLTPLKNVCLGKCRSPLGFLLGAWRDGPAGALKMGVKHGGWCVGCCWALMTALFALGVMSVAWMALVAGLVAVEKTWPWYRMATVGTVVVLVALGVLLLAAPGSLPGLTVPGHAPGSGMSPMGA